MQHHDIRVLNGLIEVTIDSADGYAEAARETEVKRFSETFRRRSSERKEIARQLQQQVQTLGGAAEDNGSVLASAHRLFVNLRKSLSDDRAVVEEVERGEDHIQARYEEALEDGQLSPQTQAVITEAYLSVKAGHECMRDLNPGNAHGSH